jgi:hypothetical protein
MTLKPVVPPKQSGLIADAVRDQDGGVWVRIGAPRRTVWVSAADLASEPSAVFRELNSAGVLMVTSAAQMALKHNVQACTKFREALVAQRPGWTGGFYVRGDGFVLRPRSDSREVIATFEPNPKFTPRGKLEEWQASVGPFVANQPLLYFVIALALAGSLLRFAPRGYLNPQVEVVGPPEKGKTILGSLAASVWSGNPDSDVGGGELWDTTLNAVDDTKLVHCDGLVVFDEGNLIGATLKARQEFAQQVVFKLGTTGTKRRKGDSPVGEHAPLALLSTTNTSLAELLGASGDISRAAVSRMITIRLAPEAPNGIFDTVPAGSESARAASEALRQAVDQSWGGAGNAFADELVRELSLDENAFRADIDKEIVRWIRKTSIKFQSARIEKAFALISVAARFARDWEIIPQSWGDPDEMILAVAEMASGSSQLENEDPFRTIADYVKLNGSSLIEVTKLERPLSSREFETATGFLRRTTLGRELLVPSLRFQRKIPDHQNIMRALRKIGKARTEEGLKPKLTIKTPKTICADGRVYCILLPDDKPIRPSQNGASHRPRGRIRVILTQECIERARRAGRII